MKIGKIEKYILNDKYISLEEAINRCPIGYRMLSCDDIRSLDKEIEYNIHTNTIKIGNIILPINGNINIDYGTCNCNLFITWILDNDKNIVYCNQNKIFTLYNLHPVSITQCHCLYIKK